MSSASEILQFAQRKKKLKIESFIVKYHLVIMLASLTAFSVIFTREKTTGAIDCSIKRADMSPKEFNSYCINGRIYHITRPEDYPQENRSEKSPDFG